MKQFRQGLIVGRFQGFHLGHRYVIDEALSHCDRVLVFIGSSNQSGTRINPFEFELRAEILRAVYGRRIKIRPLPDIGVGDCAKWGDYVITRAVKEAGMPDCVVYGNEDKCKKWFVNFPDIHFVSLDRQDIPVNATILRKMILDNDRKGFEQFTDPRVWQYFETMREKLLAVEESN